MHPVVLVSLLKECFEDSVRPEREQVLQPVLELVGNHDEYKVETILNKRKLRSRDTEYLVKWQGYHVKETTWVPSSDLRNTKRAVQDFKGSVVTISIVIHKMSCTHTQTPSHKPNGKSIQNKDNHAYAHNKTKSKTRIQTLSNSLFYFVSIGLVK